MINMQKTRRDEFKLSIYDVAIVDTLNSERIGFLVNEDLFRVLESLDKSGSGPELDALNCQLVDEHNTGERLYREKHSGKPLLYTVGGDAQIGMIRYDNGQELRGFTFQEYVEMGRPRILKVERSVTDLFSNFIPTS